MANLILTEKCNKHCSYCFAKGEHSSSPEMSVEQAQLIIDTFWGVEPIRFLGGEPTIAKNFKEILNYISTKRTSFQRENPGVRPPIVSVISNMLFNQDILNFLIPFIKEDAIAFLANVTSLDEENRFLIAKKNIKTICGLTKKISFSFTISPDKSLEWHLNQVNFLIENFPEAETFRLSAPFPPGNTQINPIGNFELGTKIYEVFKAFLEKDKIPYMSCVTLPCMFSYEQYSYIRTFAETSIMCDFKGGGALDISPEGCCFYCYPTSAIKTNPCHFSKEFLEARPFLIDKLSQLKNPYINTCKNCRFFKLGLCKGPCPGYIS